MNSFKLPLRRWLFPCSPMLALACWAICGLPSSLAAADSTDQIRFAQVDAEAPVVLAGRDARHQLLVSRVSSAAQRDITHQVTYTTSPSDIVAVSDTGLVHPLATGEATVTARSEDGLSTSVQVVVTGFEVQQPVHFANQIVPIFTKLGCNGGGCHGKAAGQNGFKLSLLGFQPEDDYAGLVIESRGRRIFPTAPQHSLLLLKALNESPHGGGQRMQKDSHEYRLLRRWIAQGAPRGDPDAAHVTSINVFPPESTVTRGSHQQLRVTAVYSDGSREDITRTVQYECNDTAMANVDENGFVTVADLTGDFAVMARYQGLVSVYSGSVPLEMDTSAAIVDLPPPRNPIDEAINAKLARLNIPASPRCDDATFIRRVTLDLAGRLPTVEEARAFSADSSADKRDELIERLLDSPDYAQWFASKWMTILRNERKSTGYQYGTYAFARWIRRSLAENKPYDQFVRQIITATGHIDANPPVAWYRTVATRDERVEDAAQLFLGQRIQCARCHHHPFEKWSQTDYFQMAAFFSMVGTKPGSTPDQPALVSKVGMATARHPRTGKALQPVGLDAEPQEIAAAEDPRVVLADWMTNPDNPFFAKALVNRYWKHFFGRGIVDPEDDLRVTNPPSNVPLLEHLADEFVRSGYDLRALVRHICQSEAYQRSSEANAFNVRDEKSHSRFYPKRLTAEVMLDAIDDVLETDTKFAGMPAGTRAISLPDTGFDSYFLTVFGRPAAKTACECERTTESNLAQSLHLLNSSQMLAKLTDDGGRSARYAGESPNAKATETQLNELYLAALSRPPTASELSVSLQYLQDREDRRQAFEDLTWALINTKEFGFNH
ncbi:DUF1549 domain-containing protein [Roseimaritima ulvae]|nr:DUF1549 domain-containing protein [Roseimaritima ulvae]